MITKDEAFRLTRFNSQDLGASARTIRDEHSKTRITYSPKVFLPLTQLCQDSCSYCSFAKSPELVENIYMNESQIINICEQGADAMCGEALFTLGESPEKKYLEAAQWLYENKHSSTIDYLAHCARLVLTQTGLLPHVNPGAISDRDLRALKEVSVSQGMMLETIAGRLSEPGGPHFGSPDKTPARRLATLEAAGRAQVPFTTGLLVGIGDTRHERIEALLAIRDLHQRYGHVQEVIIQNFLPKPNTGMASDPPCSDEEHLWTISAARLVFENTLHIQAPPNLTSSITSLIDAGVDDLGGISPVTIDYVNPERPWPHLDTISNELLALGKKLKARAAIYPEFIDKPGFVAEHVRPYIKAVVDGAGFLSRSPLDSENKNFVQTPPAIDLVTLETSEETAVKPSPSKSSKPKSRSSRTSNLPFSKSKK